MNRALLTGATGLVGSHLLRLLIDDPRVDEIIASARRALPAMRKVINPVEADLTDVLGPLQISLDTVFFCLGTTHKQAFIHVDYILVVDSGLSGLRLGAKQMLVVSAHGANRHSLFFYNRVKGEMENALRHQGWQSLTLVRPSLLLGDRTQSRRGESLMAPLFSMLPGNWRAVTASDVARCLHQQAFTPDGDSVTIIESGEIPLGEHRGFTVFAQSGQSVTQNRLLDQSGCPVRPQSETKSDKQRLAIGGVQGIDLILQRLEGVIALFLGALLSILLSLGALPLHGDGVVAAIAQRSTKGASTSSIWLMVVPP